MELEPLKDPERLPKNINEFEKWHCKALRRLDKCSEKKSFINNEVNMHKFIPILQELGLIDWAYYSDALSYLNFGNLKEILKQCELKVSGKKQDLIDRILDDANEIEVRGLDAYSDFYILTPKGHEIADEYYLKYEQYRMEFLKENIDLILCGEFDDAFRNACKRNAEMPIPPGINCEWDKWYYKGIFKSYLWASSMLMNETKDRIITASTIWGFYSGDSKKTIANTLTYMYGRDESQNDLCAKIHDENGIISACLNYYQYIENGIEKYMFLGTLDEVTCSICGKLDGKIFNVKDMKIGLNCPPMHNGCRCTTIGVNNENDLRKLHRIARDPITHKCKKIPMISHEEWIEQYSKR